MQRIYFEGLVDTVLGTEDKESIKQTKNPCPPRVDVLVGQSGDKQDKQIKYTVW